MSPHNIYFDLKTKRIVFIDNICLDSDNYEDFKDEFTDPDYFNTKEANVYSVGLISYVLLGLKPEIDLKTNKFKSPTFPDNFSKFWEDFITLSIRANEIDRPSINELKELITLGTSFERAYFINVSSKLLNHDDYVIGNPIGAGGESVIYLATNKYTNEKHSCKKVKYDIKSIQIKKILLAMEQLENSLYGIKYYGISTSNNEVLIHMEYIPNGSLGRVIDLYQRMKAPSWFTEPEKIRIAKEIAEGMLELHNHGIIHKDLKPENILLDKNNSIKICDFSFIPEDGESTLLFMAPELWDLKHNASFKSDEYSYAVTLASLFGGGEMISTVKTAASGGFRPSIAVGTPLSIQKEIIEELKNAYHDEDDLRIDSMNEFPLFDVNTSKGILSERYEYEICEIEQNADNDEYLVRLHMTIQPDNMLHIYKYCRMENKIILILEKTPETTFDIYLSEKKRVSSSKGEIYINDFISIFELYHKNGFSFGSFSLKRLFFRDEHRSSICFDLFHIQGLTRPQDIQSELIYNPEYSYSFEDDVFAFACFVFKIFDGVSVSCGSKITTRSLKSSKSVVPPKYWATLIKCLNNDTKTRPAFEVLFQKLFPVHYKIISTYLSVSTSRFSKFSMKKDFKIKEIEFIKEIGSGSFGKVVHAVNRATGQQLAYKEYADSYGKASKEDFILEYVALKAIDHPNIVKILGETQRKESVRGSRLFMEFASRGDMRNNFDEPFDCFVVHLLQISSAMKYLHQREIIHIDMKPENILIRSDGSAFVADFNTAMHVDIDTYLKQKRGSEAYMSPEILRKEKYSFPTDVFSFGMMAAEYFNKSASQVIREANSKHERPILNFIQDKKMRHLIEMCVDDDPMSRPSFNLICKYIFEKFIKGTPRAAELEPITNIPRIDEEKLNQLRIAASHGSNDAIIEYGKYLLCENMYSDAIYVYLKGANNRNASCQNTVGVLSHTDVAEKVISNSDELIQKASEQGDKFAMANYGFSLSFQENKLNVSIDLLKHAYSMGVVHACYLLGLVYEKNEIEGMSFSDRIQKAIEYYQEAARDDDAFAQYKYGLSLEEGLATDEYGFDCAHYYRLSAYQRCGNGISKYYELQKDEKRKLYYLSLAGFVSEIDRRYLWPEEHILSDEMMSLQVGTELFESDSIDRNEPSNNPYFEFEHQSNFIRNNIFDFQSGTNHFFDDGSFIF